MQQAFPGLYIETGLNEKNVHYDSYSTLFLSFTVGSQCQAPILLNSLESIEQYSFLDEGYGLTKSIQAYFENGGKRLYILSQPIDKQVFLNRDAYVKFLSKACDTLVDVETIVAIDLFDKALSSQNYIEIQNSISVYCGLSNRITIADLPKEFDARYHEELYNTVSFYPWLESKKGDIIPPSSFASALFNKIAIEENIALSIANRVLVGAVDSHGNLEKYQIEKLHQEGVTPILYFREEGYKIWGVKTLNFDNEGFEYLNTLRVFKYIKRTLYQISRQYVFEANNYDLKNRLLRQIKMLLLPMWRNGALQGDKEEEAFVIICDNRNNSQVDKDAGALNIDIAVSISKPLEYIMIHLNRVQHDNNHANMNIS